MRKIFKIFLQLYLKYITKLALLIHRPTIIAIAGSTNKSFVKEKIKKTLEKKELDVRANPKNFNTEIGLPLSILYLPSGYNSYLNWLPIIIKAPLKIFQKFPKYLILELGTSNQGDMNYLLSIVKPKITIITEITQKHLEGFKDMDKLVGEYKSLIKKTKKDGLILLNYDNIRIKSLEKNITQKLETFSINNKSNWQAIEMKKIGEGQSIKVNHNDVLTDHKINRFGKHHVYVLLIDLIIERYLSKK